jgi:hypothetical protein
MSEFTVSCPSEMRTIESFTELATPSHCYILGTITCAALAASAKIFAYLLDGSHA